MATERTARDELRAQTKMMAQKRATEGFVYCYALFFLVAMAACATWPDVMPDAPWYIYALVIGIFTGWLSHVSYKRLLNG